MNFRLASEFNIFGPSVAGIGTAMNGGARLLPALLSVIAGSGDAASFLVLGLFSAHVTGNLVILMANLVKGRADDGCLILSIPIFILALGITRLAVAGLELLNIHSLRPLLWVQFLMLGGACVFYFLSHHHGIRQASGMILASQLSVGAMAVQNALGLLSLPNAPSTAVMTTNLTRLVMDFGETLLGHDAAEKAKARQRAKNTSIVIIGFAVGAALSAICFALVGPKSLGLPAGLALLALVLGAFAGPVVTTQRRFL